MSRRLQAIVDHIASEFAASGLLRRDYGRQNVKLHITLMNSMFRKDKSGDRKPEKRMMKRETFNARQILDVSITTFYTFYCIHGHL